MPQSDDASSSRRRSGVGGFAGDSGSTTQSAVTPHLSGNLGTAGEWARSRFSCAGGGNVGGAICNAGRVCLVCLVCLARRILSRPCRPFPQPRPLSPCLPCNPAAGTLSHPGETLGRLGGGRPCSWLRSVVRRRGRREKECVGCAGWPVRSWWAAAGTQPEARVHSCGIELL